MDGVPSSGLSPKHRPTQPSRGTSVDRRRPIGVGARPLTDPQVPPCWSLFYGFSVALAIAIAAVSVTSHGHHHVIAITVGPLIAGIAVMAKGLSERRSPRRRLSPPIGPH